jgi:hypothetical protein
VRTATYPGKERRRGKFAGYRPDWKKGVRAFARWRKDAGIRAESVRPSLVARRWPLAGTNRCSGKKKLRAKS